MIQSRLHIHNELKHFRRFARFFEITNCLFAYFRIRVVQLRQEQTERPGVGLGTAVDELTQMLGSIQADVLLRHCQLRPVSAEEGMHLITRR